MVSRQLPAQLGWVVKKMVSWLFFKTKTKIKKKKNQNARK